MLGVRSILRLPRTLNLLVTPCSDTAPSSGATGQIRLNGRFALEHGVKEAMEDFPSLAFEFEGYSPGCFGRRSCRWVALVPGKTRRHVLQYQEFSEASSSVLRKAIVQDSLATIHGYIRTTRDAGWSRSIVRDNNHDI
ncbi:hypothetical protein TWF569_011550 [Orbilia oligospora]|nr:hypothetical protein TWF569_011550 [Orbilia oligospora]KAF3133127.1 hypothetical protein TWF594_009342 [Orbilia oligospora]